MKRVLVVTLESGEGEFKECCVSVCAQEGVEVEHIVLRGLPKQQAHQRLYAEFNARREQFDFFLKLDADMVFSCATSLRSMLEEVDAGLDAVSFTVLDRLTQSRMWGVNFFTPRCCFEANKNDALFTDRVPVTFPGHKVSIVDYHDRVLHASNPTDFQAYMFGVHRAFKILQPHQQGFNISPAFYQLEILRKVNRNYRKASDKKAFLALCGADNVFCKKISEDVFVSKSHFECYFLDSIRRMNDGWNLDVRDYGFPLLDLLKIHGFINTIDSIVNHIRKNGLRLPSRILK